VKARDGMIDRVQYARGTVRPVITTAAIGCHSARFLNGDDASTSQREVEGSSWGV